MTGELFALLGAHGTLAPLMETAGDAPDDISDDFAAGVEEARRKAPLSHALFGVRARVVAGAMPGAASRAFVSGLLIGTEYAATVDLLGAPAQTVTIIGAAPLAARHARAAAAFGIRLETIDPDRAYCAALARLAPGMRA
jgi:2-dehydro-3-deoxygalactonokinase